MNCSAKKKYRTAWRGPALLAADLVAVLAVTVFVLIVADRIAPEVSMWGGCWVVAVCLVLLNWFARLYCGSIVHPGLGVGAVEELKRLTLNAIAAYLLSGCLVMCNSWTVWGLWLLGAGLAALILPGSRYLVRRLMWFAHIGRIPVLIAGNGEAGTQLVTEFARNRFVGFEVVGIMDDEPVADAGVPWLGRLDQVLTVAAENGVTYLVCALNDREKIPQILQWGLHFEHVLVLNTEQMLPIQWVYPAAISHFSGLEIGNRMLRRNYQLCKRIFEYFSIVVALPVVLPLMAVLAAAVKCSSRGPVLYSAERLGKNGVPFRIWKFRTMYHDADSQLAQMLAEDPLMLMEWTEKFKLKNDPRVTPLGRLMRRTSLDELPQIWNVLRGEMALIGPRPIVEMERHYYGANWDSIVMVKPGVTGLWQVSGRSELSYAQRVMLDLYYLNNWSVWLDYYIFLKTAWAVLRCHGAR